MFKKFIGVLLSAAMALSCIPQVMAEGEDVYDKVLTYGDESFIALGATSSNEEVIKIGENGIAEIVGVGTAVLTADDTEMKVKVEPKEVTVGELSVFPKEADGGRNTIVAAVSLPVHDAVGDDDVVFSLKSATAEFETAEPGKDIPVKISGIKLEGKDMGFYTVDDTIWTKAEIVEKLTPQMIADLITEIYQPEGMKKLNVPQLPDGYKLELKSSSDESVIDADMNVIEQSEDKEVEVVLTVIGPEIKETPEPSVTPSAEPTAEPSAEPSAEPTAEPSADPSDEPSADDENSDDNEAEEVQDTNESKQEIADETAEPENTENAPEEPDAVTDEPNAEPEYITADTKPITVKIKSSVPRQEEPETRVVTVTVTASEEGESVTGAGEYNFGDVVTLKSVSRTVKYWSVNGVRVSEHNPYVFTATEDVTVHVVFMSKNGGSLRPITYKTISFETNGGTEMDSIKVPRNTVAKKPAEPARAGYIFDGWYEDKDLKTEYKFKTRVLEDMTLYAGWRRESSSGSGTGTSAVQGFYDVASNAWYAEAVEYVRSRRIMQGMTSTTFEPNTILTRAMFVTVLYRAEGEPDLGTRSGFGDVPSNSWYAEAVTWAVSNDIVSGYDDVTFAPNDIITREQMAAMMYRYAAYYGYDMTGAKRVNGFRDADSVSDWAVAAVQWAIDVEILSGMGNNELQPKGTATRAQCASIIMRCVENLNMMTGE